MMDWKTNKNMYSYINNKHSDGMLIFFFIRIFTIWLATYAALVDIADSASQNELKSMCATVQLVPIWFYGWV